MAEEKSVSDILAKYAARARQAHEAHAADPTEFSNFGDLPDGIENGIAQLTDVKLDLYKTGDLKGEPYLYMAGTVVSPEYVGDVKVAGGQTRLTHPLCDTPKSRGLTDFTQHYAWVLNEIRKLGVQTEGTTFDDLPGLIALLLETAPFFRFRTWKGKPTPEYPNPRVNHQWNGLCDPPEGFNPDDGAAGTEETPPEPAPQPPAPSVRKAPTGGAVATGARQAGQNSGQPTGPRSAATQAAQAASSRREGADASARQGSQATRPAPKAGPAPATRKAPPPPPPEPEPVPQFSEEDIPTLVEKATDGDESAQQELVRMASNAGASDADVQKCQTWEEVAALSQPQTEQEEETAEQESGGQEWSPETGQVYLYRPLDMKTKKPVAKAVECEVVAVALDKKTVDLKSLEDPKKVYKAVKWDSLEGE